MEDKISYLMEYFKTQGTLDQLVAFGNALASETWGVVARLFQIAQGVI